MLTSTKHLLYDYNWHYLLSKTKLNFNLKLNIFNKYAPDIVNSLSHSVIMIDWTEQYVTLTWEYRKEYVSIVFIFIIVT